MPSNSGKINIYLEIGGKKTFAGALDWPGWCRSGKDGEAAARALFEYRLRYERALKGAETGFQPPDKETALSIVERLRGNATTDFGSPGMAPASDSKPMGKPELMRSTAILNACWRAFDRAVKAAGERELRKGPRGGGRTLTEMIRHLLDANAAYLGKIGWAFQLDPKADPAAEFRRMRAVILNGLAASAAGKLPAKGPRGGSRWTARYFVRRVAWHALDHAWEIEDRT
ncbi:MAG: DinB family protein [Anaerolineales bacterium]